MNKFLLSSILAIVLVGLFQQTHAEDIDVEFYYERWSYGKVTLQDYNTVHELKSYYAGENKVYSDKVKFYVLRNRKEIETLAGVDGLVEMKDDDKLGKYKPKQGPLLVRLVYLPNYRATH